MLQVCATVTPTGRSSCMTPRNSAICYRRLELTVLRRRRTRERVTSAGALAITEWRVRSSNLEPQHHVTVHNSLGYLTIHCRVTRLVWPCNPLLTSGRPMLPGRTCCSRHVICSCTLRVAQHPIRPMGSERRPRTSYPSSLSASRSGTVGGWDIYCCYSRVTNSPRSRLDDMP